LVPFLKKGQRFFLKKEAKTVFCLGVGLGGGVGVGGEDTPANVALEVHGNRPVGLGFTLS
jgi:hypothetical protein